MRQFLIIFSLLLLCGKQALACGGDPGSVERIVCLADSLKSSLSSSQLSALQVSYSYANAQTWSNLPVGMQPRLGIQLGSLSSAQLGIALLLIKDITGTLANEGYDEFSQIRLADAYLMSNGGGSGYGAGLYYLCFNGTPTLTGLFSVKIGGHHLQYEQTYNQGVMVGATPQFLGLEPLSFTASGTTYATMAQEKDALAAMLASLSSAQLNTAKLSATFSDLLMGARNNGTSKDWTFPSAKVGIRAGDLSTAQKALVLEAIKTYVQDVDSLHANDILNQYSQELDETYIAYSGTSGLSTRNDYVRIDGPGVWIEFSVQNGIVLQGVHYHSIWRDHLRDYGGAGSTAGVASTGVGLASTAIEEVAGELSSAYLYSQFTRMHLVMLLPRRRYVLARVVSAQGRVIRTIFDGVMPPGNTELSFEMNEAPSGVYILQLLSGQESRSLKFVNHNPQ